MIPIRRARLATYNQISLAGIFTVLLLRSYLSETHINWVFWPGAFVLTISLLSTWLIQQTTFLKDLKHQLRNPGFYLSAFGFGLLYVILKDLLILLLERFFRLGEHYEFLQLLSVWINEWYRILEGMAIYFFYQLLIAYVDLRFSMVEQQKEIEDLQQRVEKTSLKSMIAELNPHFLFNAMNSISMTIRLKEYAKSVEMIANLNDLLRKVLSTKDTQLISLQEELALLDKYLEIEMIRFGDRVEVEREYDPNLMGAQVPQLILQPLVENAFKHGMSEDVGKQKISINIQKHDGKLLMSVFNSTKSNLGIDVGQGRKGVGLTNILQRLTRLYGNQFKFQREQQTNGVEYRIIIPIRL